MARILVVDDDEIVRAALCGVLSAKGHAVSETESGQSAVHLHRAEPFKLIITDILMPDFDGIEVIRRLRQVDPGVKIMAVSGGGWADPDHFLAMAERLGADATFSKPFNWETLVAAVERLVAPQRQV